LNEIVNFFREILPVRTELTWGTISTTIGTLFVYLIGGFDNILSALFAVIAIDYFTGFAASFFETEKSKGPSSARGLKGIVKKAFMIALVMLAHQVDVVAGGGNLARTMTICFFFGNEGLSILENTARMGLPVPSALKNKLAQLAEEKTEVRQ